MSVSCFGAERLLRCHLVFLVSYEQAYDNAAVTIDELPPPFAEGDYVKSEDKAVVVSSSSGPETSSAINSLTLSTVTVIPARDGQEGTSA